MSPYLNPMGKMFELVPTPALIVVAGFAVSVLLAQDDFDSIRQAAEKGDAEAQFNLAAMYDQGEGGAPPDEAEAVRWLRLAAEQGDAKAQFNLGGMYAQGRGGVKDSVLAHMWLNIAVANGDESARKGQDILERDLTRAEMSRANELARTCMASNYKNCGP